MSRWETRRKWEAEGQGENRAAITNGEVVIEDEQEGGNKKWRENSRREETRSGEKTQGEQSDMMKRQPN